MDNKKLENIKAKIKGLLALSEGNTTDAESISALAKAQELMAKYKLEQSDISDEKKQECIRLKTTLSYGTRSSDHYLDDLATVVAENFCCINYISTPRGSRTHYISLMGLKDDVDIAHEVLATANMQIIRGYNRVYKQICEMYGLDYVPASIFNPRKNGYALGYIEGLKEALAAQKEKNQEWGLVMVVPKEAQDYKMNLNTVDFSSPASDNINSTFYSEGYNDGKNFKYNKKIEGTEDHQRIE